MAKGERSVFIVPASLMRHPKPPARDDDEGSGSDSGGDEEREEAAGGDVCDPPPMVVPPAPEKGTQVEVMVHLISLVQVCGEANGGGIVCLWVRVVLSGCVGRTWGRDQVSEVQGQGGGIGAFFGDTYRGMCTNGTHQQPDNASLLSTQERSVFLHVSFRRFLVLCLWVWSQGGRDTQAWIGAYTF